jgi:hypothetical protein
MCRIHEPHGSLQYFVSNDYKPVLLQGFMDNMANLAGGHGTRLANQQWKDLQENAEWWCLIEEEKLPPPPPKREFSIDRARLIELLRKRRLRAT